MKELVLNPYSDQPLTLEYKVEELPRHKNGLQYTATGYGAKIPTRYKVSYNNRWYRVYCKVYSNIGSLYIVVKGSKITVKEY